MEPQGSLGGASGCLPVSHQIASGYTQVSLRVAGHRRVEMREVHASARGSLVGGSRRRDTELRLPLPCPRTYLGRIKLAAPPPILAIMRWNLPIFFIICCIWAKRLSMVFNSVTVTPLPLATRWRGWALTMCEEISLDTRRAAC